MSEREKLERELGLGPPPYEHIVGHLRVPPPRRNSSRRVVDTEDESDYESYDDKPKEGNNLNKRYALVNHYFNNGKRYNNDAVHDHYNSTNKDSHDKNKADDDDDEVIFVKETRVADVQNLDDDEVVFVPTNPTSSSSHPSTSNETKQTKESTGKDDDEHEVEAVVEKFTVRPLVDYAHMRSTCGVYPFAKGTAARLHCAKCYCFVCDIPASQCTTWNRHAEATDKSQYYRSLRTKRRNLAANPPNPPSSNVQSPVRSGGNQSTRMDRALANVRTRLNATSDSSVRAGLSAEIEPHAPESRFGRNSTASSAEEEIGTYGMTLRSHQSRKRRANDSDSVPTRRTRRQRRT